MIEEDWNKRRMTGEAQRILKQIPQRANDRGLHVVDESSIVVLALWSLLLWELKIGRVALERTGVDHLNLARDIDRLLIEKAGEHPVAFDTKRKQLVLLKTGDLYQAWDFAALLEPLLQAAEHEATSLGHNYVGSEHLLLAIVRMACPKLRAVLEGHSIEQDRLRTAVQKFLAPNSR